MWVEFRESGDFRDIPHLFHFIELLFVFFSKYGEDINDVRNITFPQWAGDSWMGKEGKDYNRWILERIWGKGLRIEPGENLDVIIDRGSLPNGNINKSWCKEIRNFDPYLWSNKLRIPRSPNKLPVVTYINRQNSQRRRMPEVVHHAFLNRMRVIPGIVFRDIMMEELSFEHQFNIANETDLLIGVHGNGLSHAAFMRPHRNVVEIFTPNCKFHWDYYTLSKMMGHEYLCIFDSCVTLPHVFVKNRDVVCTSCVKIPIRPIIAIIDQIKEEK